jgi:hypothetical protein
MPSLLFWSMSILNGLEQQSDAAVLECFNVVLFAGLLSECIHVTDERLFVVIDGITYTY